MFNGKVFLLMIFGKKRDRKVQIVWCSVLVSLFLSSPIETESLQQESYEKTTLFPNLEIFICSLTTSAPLRCFVGQDYKLVIFFSQFLHLTKQ